MLMNMHRDWAMAKQSFHLQWLFPPIWGPVLFLRKVMRHCSTEFCSWRVLPSKFDGLFPSPQRTSIFLVTAAVNLQQLTVPIARILRSDQSRVWQVDLSWRSGGKREKEIQEEGKFHRRGIYIAPPGSKSLMRDAGRGSHLPLVSTVLKKQGARLIRFKSDWGSLISQWWLIIGPVTRASKQRLHFPIGD